MSMNKETVGRLSPATSDRSRKGDPGPAVTLELHCVDSSIVDARNQEIAIHVSRFHDSPLMRRLFGDLPTAHYLCA